MSPSNSSNARWKNEPMDDRSGFEPFSLNKRYSRLCSRWLTYKRILVVISACTTISLIASDPHNFADFTEDREFLGQYSEGSSSHGHLAESGGLTRWYLSNTTLRQSLVFEWKVPADHVWPRHQRRSDRIEHQLMMRPKTPPTQDKLILLNIHGDNTKPPTGRAVFTKSNCPVAGCLITYNFTRASEATALVFKDRVNPVLIDKHAYKRPTDQIWILNLLESPYYTDDFSILDGHINWTATYRQDSELVTPYEKFVLYHPTVLSKRQTVNYAAKKRGRKKVAWFVSNCDSINDRIAYARELAKYIEVDIFGNCGSKNCDKGAEACEEILRRDYKFYLSFENSNCWWYITEKLWMPLRNDVIPIVMGAPRMDYEAVAPFKSFIHVSDFPTPRDLANYLQRLDRSEREYNSYFQWKGTGELIDTRFYCRLCALLHADTIPVNTYHDIKDWWSGPRVCSNAAK